MLKNIKNIMFLLVFFLQSFFYVSLAVGQGATDWLNEGVTIRFQDEPMSAVLGKISQQTGIAILYDENLAGEKVTGHYKDIKFSEAIDRLFSEKNKSIQVFKGEKKIIVKTFGAKQFILAGKDSAVDSTDSEDESEKMSLAQVEERQRQRYNEYKKRITDENEVLEGGITRGELRIKQKKQYTEYKERIADENEVLEGGITRGELRVKQKKQYEEYKKRIADENEVLEGGITRGELRVKQKRLNAEYKKRIADENEVLEGGITRGELRAKQKKQYEEYKKRVVD
ncbi:MAG: hypothetical protein D3906_04395 [Candidatus Electrothrix sp. AUS1_2]|nr:hypothetical protein [Candidatus Electrothrix sp. AUS1_2]